MWLFIIEGLQKILQWTFQYAKHTYTELSLVACGTIEFSIERTSEEPFNNSESDWYVIYVFPFLESKNRLIPYMDYKNKTQCIKYLSAPEVKIPDVGPKQDVLWDMCKRSIVRMNMMKIQIKVKYYSKKNIVLQLVSQSLFQQTTVQRSRQITLENGRHECER